jgi:hypothetical protein
MVLISLRTVDRQEMDIPGGETASADFIRRGCCRPGQFPQDPRIKPLSFLFWQTADLAGMGMPPKR